MIRIRIQILIIVFLVVVEASMPGGIILSQQNKTREIKEAKVTYKRPTPAKSEPKVTETPKQETQQTNRVVTPAQTNTPVKEKMDTIIKLGGRKIICSVKKVGASSVTYSLPNSVVQQEILRKDIEKIIYKSGKVDIFNKPVFSVVDKLDWQAVMITEKEEDVRGLYKRGVIKATASSGSRSPKAAKQSATIRMQKKAANMGALIVLVVRSEMKGGYGEIPGWELEGIAYSDTPPSDTAAVNKAIRELIDRTNREKLQNQQKK